MRCIYRITYHGTAFGDNLFTAYVTRVLRQYGFDARLDNPRIADLVDCAVFAEKERPGHTEIRRFGCVRQNRTGVETTEAFSVYSDLLTEFARQFDIGYEIEAVLDHVPVKFEVDSASPSYDVAMVTETGSWTPYRNWPYFSELKEMLSTCGISWIDLSAQKIRGNRTLNVVRNCRLFLGLETGVSHYVSKFANGKALILQSGYTPFSYWAGVYDYEFLTFPVSCSPCWKRSGCVDHRCMVELSAERVLLAIRERL